MVPGFDEERILFCQRGQERAAVVAHPVELDREALPLVEKRRLVEEVGRVDVRVLLHVEPAPDAQLALRALERAAIEEPRLRAERIVDGAPGDPERVARLGAPHALRHGEPVLELLPGRIAAQLDAIVAADALAAGARVEERVRRVIHREQRGGRLRAVARVRQHHHARVDLEGLPPAVGEVGVLHVEVALVFQPRRPDARVGIGLAEVRAVGLEEERPVFAEGASDHQAEAAHEQVGRCGLLIGRLEQFGLGLNQDAELDRRGPVLRLELPLCGSRTDGGRKHKDGDDGRQGVIESTRA